MNTTNNNATKIKEAIRDEISSLKRIFEAVASKEKSTLSEAIIDLREYVLHVHAITEEHLYYHSISFILDIAAKDSNMTEDKYKSIVQLTGSLDGYLDKQRTFKSLYDFAKEFGALPVNILEDIWTLNEIRNQLVHTRKEKWKKFEDDVVYLKTLNLLKKVLTEMGEYDAKMAEQLKEQMEKEGFNIPE